MVADEGPAAAEFSLLIDVWIHNSQRPERDLYNGPEMFAHALMNNIHLYELIKGGYSLLKLCSSVKQSGADTQRGMVA